MLSPSSHFSLPPSPRTKHRLAVGIAPLLFLLASVGSLAAETTLTISSTSALAGETSAIEITLATTERIAALAFVLEFDAAKLSIDPALITLSGAARNAGFALTTFSEAPGRLGIALYASRTAAASIGSGPLLRIPVGLLPSADGFARIAIAADPPPTASTPEETIVEISTGAGMAGVTVTPLRASLGLSPTFLDLGRTGPGEAIEKTVVVSNVGTAPLTIPGFMLEPSEGRFYLIEPVQTPLVLAPGASISIRVGFRADQSGHYETRLTIEGTSPTRSGVIAIAATVTDGPGFVYGNRRLLPSVVHVDMPDGSRWRSTLSLFNPTAGNLGVRLRFILDSNRTDSADLLLGPSETRTFDDVIGELFGASATTGAIVIDSSSPDLVSRSSVYRQHLPGGRTSQSIPIVPWTQLFRTGQTGSLIGLESSSEKRTTFTFLNLGTTDVTLRAMVLNKKGELVGSHDVTLAAGEVASGVDLFAKLEVTSGTEFTVRVAAVTADATFFVFASTLDTRSGSPLFQPLQ